MAAGAGPGAAPLTRGRDGSARPALARQIHGGEQRDYDTAGTHPRDRCDGRSPWDLIWQKKYGALRHLAGLVRDDRRGMLLLGR